MKSLLLSLLVLVLSSCGGGDVYLVNGPLPSQDLKTFSDLSPQTVQLSREEKRLAGLVMEYRARHGLVPIPLSPSLTYVAKRHLLDLEENKPAGGSCNGHSWSGKGDWSGCCYTSDHEQAQCMWDKPRELTRYTGDGFEIAFGADGMTRMDFSVSADVALRGWQGSRFHNEVILNQRVWKKHEWKAMGVAIYKTSAAIWFGKQDDPEGMLE